MPWKEVVGESFDAASFDAYWHGLSWNQLRPQFGGAFTLLEQDCLATGSDSEPRHL